MSLRKPPKKFLVAFSFASEQRELVEQIATAVERFLCEGNVFYDEWFVHIIGGRNADLTLQDIYLNKSVLVIPCISKEYGDKVWPQDECEVIRTRCKGQTNEKTPVLPLRVGEGVVPGFPTNNQIFDVRNWTLISIVDLIVGKLQLIDPDVVRQIFLAPPSRGMENRYDKIKNFLIDLGWAVVPRFPEYPDEFRAQLEGELARSRAFIQILGDTPSAVDLAISRTAKERKMIGIRVQIAEGACTSLRTTELNSDDFPDLIFMRLPDFKVYLKVQLELLEDGLVRSPKANTPQNVPSVGIVIRSQSPQLVATVVSWCGENGISKTRQVNYNESIETRNKKDPCDGFLVVCDQNPTATSDLEGTMTLNQVIECRKIQLAEKSDDVRPPVGLVYWPPPSPQVKQIGEIVSLVPPLIKIEGDKPAMLLEFFAQVKKVQETRTAQRGQS